MPSISPAFDQPGAAFVLLRVGQKFPPIEAGWQNKPHDFEEAAEHTGKGGNAGILAGNGYIGLDQDDPAAFEGLVLPISTTWETRPGRYGLWFKVSDDVAAALAGIGKKADQAQLKLFRDGKPCGEVKLQRTYQVIPPSWKTLENGTRADYRLLQEIPPAEISLAKLLADLQAIGITFSSKLEQNAVKLESMAREARRKRADPEENRLRRYAEAALEDEVRVLSSAPTGSRNEQLNRSAFALGQFVAAGVFSEAEVARELTRAAMSVGLEPEEIRATIASGLESGSRHPREIPKQEKRNGDEKRADEEAAKKAETIRLEDVANIEYDKNGELEKARLSPTRASNAVLERMILAMSEGSEDIYQFNGNVYKPDGARIIDQALCNAAADLNTAYQLKETLRRIRNKLLDHPVVFDQDPYLLGCKNGVVDLRTGNFRDYRPEDFITDQIQVVYNPAARCPRFVQFLEEVCPNPVDRLMLVDWYAIHAIRSMFPYVMFLNGLGRNGKGIYERVMQRFYGDQSFSHMPLEELAVKNNRFAGADLAGKRGQIVAEAGESHAKGKRTIPTAFLKNATGDGIIDSDQKNKGRIKFKPFYKSTIDANDMPRIEDTSKGWIERFCKADMPYHYVDNPLPGTVERKKDPALFEKLTTESELSGILNLIIDRAPEIIRTKTITKRPGEEMFAEYQRQSSSVLTFLETFCDYKSVSDSSKDIFLDIVFAKYEEWCVRTVADKVDASRFGKAVKTFCKGIEPERVRDGDKKRKIYHGLSFDVNRYHAQWDQYRTNDGPIKTVSGPMGPINEEKTWEYIREKFGCVIESGRNTPDFSVIGPDSDCKNSNGHDSGSVGPQNRFTGHDSDLSKGRSEEKASDRDCGEVPPDGVAQPGDSISPAEKARLWDSISSKLKKCGRVDGKRRGIAEHDLQPDEAEVVRAAGWQRETTGTGISILWATEKSIAAMGLEAGT